MTGDGAVVRELFIWADWFDGPEMDGHPKRAALPGFTLRKAAAEIERLTHDIERHIAICSASEARASALLAALEFYGDAERWKPNSYGIVSAHDDGGTRARAAIASAKGETA